MSGLRSCILVLKIYYYKLIKMEFRHSIIGFRSPMVQRYDGYYDHYSSDTSSQDARSGSITPIVDKEARYFCISVRLFYFYPIRIL